MFFLFYFYKGLRLSVLLAAAGQFIGAVIRCYPPFYNWWISTLLVCCGQALSGLVAPIPLSGGVLLSATWFPSNQRTISTAIIMGSASIGGALSFIIGPLLIEDVAQSIRKHHYGRYILTPQEEAMYFNQINGLFILEAGLMGILFLGIYFHFPDKPPKPPSRSSITERANFKDGLSKLLRNRNFLLLATLYGVSCGVYSGWCSVLDQNLEEFGVGQKVAGWLGFTAVICGALSGIFFSL